MKAQIASTDRIVEVRAGGHPGITKARVWEGTTESGVRFTAYIPISQVHKEDDNFENCQLEHALNESVKLQSHYAALLNQYDGGKRLQFADARAWIQRLATIK